MTLASSLSLALFALVVGPCLASPDEIRLLASLLGEGQSDVTNYAIPVGNITQTMTVRFGIALVEADMDTSMRLLKTKMMLRFMWESNLLRWNPEDFGGVTSIRVPIQSIWSPDIKLFNSYDITMTVDDSAMAVVFSSGTVLWIPQARAQTRCQPQRGHQWECPMKFGSWTYDGFRLDVDFYEGKAEADVTDFDVSMWEATETGARKEVKYYPCCSEPYPNLKYNLKFRRHYD